MTYFIRYNNVDSRDYDLFLTTDNLEWFIPDKDLDFVEVSGRNGDLIRNNQRFKNVTQTFSLINANMDSTNRLVEWLRTSDEYKQLYTNLQPNYYFEAIPYQNLTIPRSNYRFTQFDVEFVMKPFMKSVIGQEPINIGTQPLEILNNELFAAQPKIFIQGSGEVTIVLNDMEYLIVDVDEQVTIDSEELKVYKDFNTPKDSTAKFIDFKFPELQSGFNTIQLIGDVQNAYIVPNTRRLVSC